MHNVCITIDAINTIILSLDMISNISYWPAGLNIYFLGFPSVSSYQPKELNNKTYNIHNYKVQNNIFQDVCTSVNKNR